MSDYEMLLDKLKGMGAFSRLDIYKAMLESGGNPSRSVANHTLDKLIREGYVKRTGRNEYSAGKEEKEYSYLHSDYARTIASEITEAHPYLDFRIFELVQLNEFVNHQLAHNIIFVSVEGELEGDVFDTLWSGHQGNVLLKPSSDELFRYMSDNMIVIVKLPTESPKGASEFWDTRLEKMLVDIAVDKLMRKIVYTGEYPAIYGDATQKYIIDRNMMRRYATRRGSLEKFRNFLKEEANLTEEEFAL